MDIWVLGCGIDALHATICQVRQEWGEGQLGFIEHKVVNVWELLVFHGEERSTCHHFRAEILTTSDQSSRRLALHDHGADEYIVSPRQVLGGQAGDIEIDQPFFPLSGQQCRHGEQPQGWRAGLLLDKAQRMLEAPKGIREFGVYKQDFYRNLLLGLTPAEASKPFIEALRVSLVSQHGCYLPIGNFFTTVTFDGLGYRTHAIVCIINN